MTEEPKTYNIDRIASSINGSRKTGQPHVKNDWTLILHHKQKSTQNGLKTWMQDLKP